MIARWLVVGRLVAVVVLALVVSACAVREQRPPGTWMEEREAWFADHPVWSVRGRLALRDGQRGGQLNFEWQAHGDHHRIHLRTFTGGKQWVLEFRPGYARLEGSDVGAIAGPEPDALAERAVGWPIPVTEMIDWVRGLATTQGARVEFARDGTLSRVVHDPWDLNYQRFDEIRGQLMPVRLEAESPPYRVRMVLREWNWSAEDI